MVFQDKNSANSKAAVRRFYAEFDTNVASALAANTQGNPIFKIPITKMDSVVIIPIATDDAIDHNGTLHLRCSYDEPTLIKGGENDGEVDDSVAGFTWRPYTTEDFHFSDNPDSNKIVISQFNTGITAIEAKLSRDAELSVDYRALIYVRGYFLQR